MVLNLLNSIRFVFRLLKPLEQTPQLVRFLHVQIAESYNTTVTYTFPIYNFQAPKKARLRGFGRNTFFRNLSRLQQGNSLSDSFLSGFEEHLSKMSHKRHVE